MTPKTLRFSRIITDSSVIILACPVNGVMIGLGVSVSAGLKADRPAFAEPDKIRFGD